LPLHMADFDVLAQTQAISSVLRCCGLKHGCLKAGSANPQQSGQLQVEVDELQAKLMAQVMEGEVGYDEMFNILEAFQKSKTPPPPPRVCKGSGGYAWHDASYGMHGNGGVWEYANLSHFLAAWSNATGGADVFFIGQGAHMTFDHTPHVEQILSSCAIVRKNVSTSRCIWRAPRSNEVNLPGQMVNMQTGINPVTLAIESNAAVGSNLTAGWSVFRPDDLLYHAPPEMHVDTVGHLSGAANDILNNGFLWFLWSLLGDAK